MSNEIITKIVNEKQKVLGKSGRILLRPSGTEDLVRIMVECDDSKQVEEITEIIANKIVEQNDILKNK